MIIECMIPPNTTSGLKLRIRMRKNIPKALRQQVWLKHYGKVYFENKCYIDWCNNLITPFNFEVGHNIPYSKGGSDEIDNLRPLCSSCNKSMSNKYTIDEFIELGRTKNNKEIKINQEKHSILKSHFNLPCCFIPKTESDSDTEKK